MPTLKHLGYILIGLMIFLSSCTPRYFYVSRINYYSFDTCRQVKFEGEVYFRGASGALAFSPVNHLALAVDGNLGYSTDMNNFETLFGGYPYQKSTGTQYDFSIGYFTKFNSIYGFDIFGGFGHQYVSGDTVLNENTKDNAISIPYTREYYLLSVQPSFYINSPDKANIAFGCKLSAVLNNYDTQELQTNYLIVRRSFLFQGMLLEPGFEISPRYNSNIRFGVYAHIAADYALANSNIRILTFCLKYTPKFSQDSYSNFIR